MAALTNRYEDNDASHLPPGMKRVGYDADTERYTFRDGDDLWLGEPGSFYGGHMKWAGKMPSADEDETDVSGAEYMYDTESQTHRKSLRVQTQNATPSLTESSLEIANSLWGVPVVSISATGAKPPDSPKDETNTQQTHTKTFKKVARLTANALRVANKHQQKGTT